MFEIIDARLLAASVKQFKVAAPEIARKRKPGQFVVLRFMRRENGSPSRLPTRTPRPERSRSYFRKWENRPLSLESSGPVNPYPI